MRIHPAVLVFLLSAGILFDPARTAGAQPSLYEGTESALGMPLRIDIGCILRTWRVTGVFACPAFPHGVHVCLVIENAYPVGILEAVRRPFTSHLVELAPVAAGLKEATSAVGLFGGTSSHTGCSADGTSLQFTEAHAYEFVPGGGLAVGLPLAIPAGSAFRVSYLSELDGFAWRTGMLDLIADPVQAAAKAALPSCSTVPRMGDCAWNWGSWFPRIGFAVHPSEVVAGYLLGLRAGRVAANPAGRVTLGAYPYEPRTGHYVQMVRPTWRSCVSIGWPLTRFIEAGALSREGAYLFLHYGVFRQCKGCFPARLVEPRPPAP
jgi:hypothetical protein